MAKIMIREDEDGQVVTISQKDVDACIEYINTHNITHIEIVDTYYKGEDIGFLSECPTIQSLHLDSIYLDDISGIYQLKNLKTFSAVIDENIALELGRLTTLEVLSLTWNKKYTGFNELVNLKKLHLWSYHPKTRDLQELSQLVKVEELTITQSRIDSLHGIENMKYLKNLQLNYLRALKRLDGLEALGNSMTDLEIESCKNIESYEEIQYLKGLRFLNIISCGDIPSIKFVGNLPVLNHFVFMDSNVLDGDVSLCKNIEYVYFTNKKHYSHRIQEFEK